MIKYVALLGMLFLFLNNVFATRLNNVECIAPANPGGGWDWTCRSLSRVLQELNLLMGQ